MKTINSGLLRSCAVAALAASTMAGAAHAQSQDTQTQQQTQDQNAQQSQPQQPAQGQAASQNAQAGGGQQQGGQNPTSDQLVATVGGAEIRGADVLTVIGMMPEPLRTQPAEMLVPIAVDQLVFRELMLQQAREQNLAQDPEVQSLVQQSSSAAEEDALVQVWLRRELENVVSDEAVQQTYDQLSQNAAGEIPPLEQVRPQIEQHLRQQAVADLRQSLAEGVEIVLYDPSGQPIQQSQGGSAQSEDGQDQQQQSAGGGGDTPVEEGSDAGSGN